jgi:hypothetical protein
VLKEEDRFMNAPMTAVRRLAVLGLFLLLAPAPGRAEVTRVDILRREDVLAGRSFGNAGAYEKLVGKVYFAVDPNNPHNKIIVDLDKAPRNAQGKVEFSSDLYIIKPKDPSRGNGVVFFDIVNRGNKALLGVFSRAARAPDPTTEAEFGDAYLLQQGYTLVAVGWQFDVPQERGLVGFDAPIATDNGKPITGWVRMWFISNTPVPSFDYASASYNTRAYPPLDLKRPEYRLTEREGTFGPSRLIPREEWQFARMDNGKLVPDPNSVYLKGGFKPGLTYEVAYETKDPPVAGLGLAAIRDMASALKYDPRAVAPGCYAYMYGASQTGRLIRHIVYEGFTIDEQGRKAFDGAFVQTGATGMGSFNERFAQPNELGSFTQTKFPFLYKTTTDPITGRQDGLGGARIPAGLEPKLMLVDTGSEYWDRGRVAALRHTSLDGREDIEDAPNVRVYLLAGTKHGAGSFPPADNGGQFKENTNDYRWAQRGLLAALDAWVRQGTAAPPSRHPKLSDGTLVAHRDFKFPALPGVQLPTFVPGGYRGDVPGPYSALPFLVPNVDADGNDIGGIRLPEQAVPLATLTGWQFRSERIGAPNTLIAMAGAYIPFPTTRAEREKRRDLRQSIVERYGTRADYLKKVQDAAARLAQERYILQNDVALIVQDAGRHWDYVMGPAASTSQAAR